MGDTDSTEIFTPLRVLIADAVGEELTEMLEDYDDIEVVGCAKKAIEALILAEKLHPDVLLLDLEMPGETLGLILKLIKQLPLPPKVMVSIPYSSLVLRERCLEAGADSVFTKTAELEQIAETLQKLARAKQTVERG
jgi:DNA-binding NarL/FixJ family response regulator